jgi:hypothetical protein
VVNLTVQGTATNWIVVKPASGATVNITGPGPIANAPPSYYSGIQVAGGGYLDIEDINLSGFNMGWLIQGGSSVRLHDCTTKNTYGTGIYVAYNSAFGAAPSHYEISGCTVTADNQFILGDPSAQNSWGPGITMGGSYGSVFGNVVHDGYGEGIIVLAPHSWIYDNWSYNRAATAVYVDGASYAVIEDNFVYQDQAGASAFYSKKSASQVPDCIRTANEGDNAGFTGESFRALQYLTIRNNIAWGGDTLLAYDNYIAGTPMDHVRWENNTLQGGQLSASQCMKIDPPPSGSHSDVVVANNICAWTNGVGTNAVSPPAGVTLDNQLWFQVTPGGATGTGDVTGDPLLGQ